MAVIRPLPAARVLPGVFGDEVLGCRSECVGSTDEISLPVDVGGTWVSAESDLVLEFGDRVGVLAHRSDFAAMRKYFGDSIKGTAEFSYISIGIGMALGFLLGAIQFPLPGIGKLAVGLAGVLSNGGSGHTLTDQFAVFGYHVTGSSGLLFLYGIVVAAVSLFGVAYDLWSCALFVLVAIAALLLLQRAARRR